MKKLPLKSFNFDSMTAKELKEMSSRPILYIWGAKLYVSRLCPPGCIRVWSNKKIDNVSVGQLNRPVESGRERHR